MSETPPPEAKGWTVCFDDAGRMSNISIYDPKGERRGRFVTTRSMAAHMTMMMEELDKVKEENQKLKDFTLTVATLFDQRDIDIADELFVLVAQAKALLTETPANGGENVQGTEALTVPSVPPSSQ